MSFEDAGCLGCERMTTLPGSRFCNACQPNDKLHVATMDLTAMRYASDSRTATEEETMMARMSQRARAMASGNGYLQRIVDAGEGARGKIETVTIDPALPDEAGNGVGTIRLEMVFEVAGTSEQRQAQAAAILGLGWARVKP